MYARFLALCGAAVLAAALSISTARATPPPMGLLPATTIVPLFNGWWTCPDTGVCSAPATLRLWLPSLGSGYATVEAGPVSSTCGTGCYMIPNGAVVTIRAHADPGYRFAGWVGKCSTVTVTGCWFHMRNNYAAGASFERIPPPPPPPSADGVGTVSQPVTGAISFVTQVYGKGTIMIGGNPPCTTSFPCTMTRDQGAYVKAVAVPSNGRPFVRWGGSCSGSGTTCTFLNDFDRYNHPPHITATFG